MEMNDPQSQQRQLTMYDPQVQQQHQPNMLTDLQEKEEQQNLQELSAHRTSSVSDIQMRNKIENSSGNEMVAKMVDVEAHSSIDNQRSKKKPKERGYTRHTKHQIKQMEVFFLEDPYPNADQRRAIASEIGLTPSQIQIWFHNKRRQIKIEQDHELRNQLKAENERINAENKRYTEALGKASCNKCACPCSNISEMSDEEKQLRIELGELNDEIARMSGKPNPNVGSLVMYFFNMALKKEKNPQSFDVGGYTNYEAPPPRMGTFCGGGNGEGSDVGRSFPPRTNDEKRMILELAVASLVELIELANQGPPIWIPGYSFETLNVNEYMMTFLKGIGPKPSGFRTEASRESIVVFMNHINLIEILMDVNKWTTMFSDIVTRGTTHEVLVAGNYNGYLQVMSAEFQIPSPLTPPREYNFVRFCKKYKEGSWAVVDVSLDYLRHSSTLRSQRRPSGCIIQELPNGYSKVTWVEHVDVDDRGVMTDNPYIFLINSCLAFGAKRWLASLDRQCKRLASLIAINAPIGNLNGLTSLDGMKSMLRLTERLVTCFFNSVGSSKEHVWIPFDPVDNGDDLKVMIRTSNTEPERPCGIVLSVATSFWLPVAPKRVFDFLLDYTTRSQWDFLSMGGIVQEVARIANDHDPNNRVSLLHVYNENLNLGNILILQESCIDMTGAYITYSPIDVVLKNLLLSGGDPNYIPLLPSGFAILPDGKGQCGFPIPDAIRFEGCMLTTSFQILADSNSTTTLSLASLATTVDFIKQLIRQIKVALS